MNRRDFLAIPCEDATLAATLDMPASGAAKAGLLIVTGGNEIRSGAWSGHAQLAARLAARGFAVLRFDRRGIGDSDGTNAGFRHSDADIRAALAAFVDEVHAMSHVVGWGNCDAASALMLGGGCGCDALVLSNPWTYEQADDDQPATEGEAATPMSAAELRAHYRARLLNPAALRRLFTGGVPVGKLVRSLLGVFRKAPPPGNLVQDMRSGLSAFTGPVRLLVAERDRTAQAFLAAWDKNDSRIARCQDASHSFVEPHAREWLEAQLLAALER